LQFLSLQALHDVTYYQLPLVAKLVEKIAYNAGAGIFRDPGGVTV